MTIEPLREFNSVPGNSLPGPLRSETRTRSHLGCILILLYTPFTR